MKYIKTTTDKGFHEIFLFSREIHHDAFMQELDGIKNQTHAPWFRVRREALSAGFVDSKLNCYGKSETLKLNSDPVADTDLLIKQLGM